MGRPRISTTLRIVEVRNGFLAVVMPRHEGEIIDYSQAIYAPTAMELGVALGEFLQACAAEAALMEGT